MDVFDKKESEEFLRHLEYQKNEYNFEENFDIYDVGAWMFEFYFDIGVGPSAFERYVWHSNTVVHYNIIKHLTEFLNTNKLRTIYGQENEYFYILDMFKCANNLCDENIETIDEINVKLKEKSSDLEECNRILREIGKDSILKYFVQTLRIHFDENDEIWNRFKLEKMFQ